jgi:transposase InsO family protein
MRQFNILRSTKGWLYMWERTIRFRHMRNEAEVRRRVQILDFWKKHGEEAARDAFDVSRRTLYRWQALLGEAGGRLDALDPRSTAPRKTRQRQYPDGLLERIIALCTEHPHLGKKKLAVLLEVSESCAGRCLADLKERHLLPSGKRLSWNAGLGKHREIELIRRPKLRRPEKRGMELDTVIRHVDGKKRYVLTAVDVERRFAFARAYTSHSSATAADFLRQLLTVCPFGIGEVQTDNGSEFARYFEDACTALGITHFHTYPRTPKMNAHVERFNRTLSEDFLVLNRGTLRDDPAAFNGKLVDWLFWYNAVRPHQSLGMVSPLQYIASITGGVPKVVD